MIVVAKARKYPGAHTIVQRHSAIIFYSAPHPICSPSQLIGNATCINFSLKKNSCLLCVCDWTCVHRG